MRFLLPQVVCSLTKAIDIQSVSPLVMIARSSWATKSEEKQKNKKQNKRRSFAHINIKPDICYLTTERKTKQLKKKKKKKIHVAPCC